MIKVEIRGGPQLLAVFRVVVPLGTQSRQKRILRVFLSLEYAAYFSYFPSLWWCWARILTQRIFPSLEYAAFVAYFPSLRAYLPLPTPPAGCGNHGRVRSKFFFLISKLSSVWFVSDCRHFLPCFKTKDQKKFLARSVGGVRCGIFSPAMRREG